MGRAPPRAIPRIALASGLTVALIAAAVLVTIGSVRAADQAREAARHAHDEIDVAQAAELHISRERGAMNEYLLGPKRELVDEVRAMRAAFRKTVSTLERDDVDERALVDRASAANEAFVNRFFAASRLSIRSGLALDELAARLHDAEKAVLAPLAAVMVLYERDLDELEAQADAEFRRARLAAIVAGLLAGLAALAFALYAVRLVRRVGRQKDELRRLDRMEDELLALQKVDRMKDEFIALVSHELRTPLTSIRGYLEILTDGSVGRLTTDQEQCLEVVGRNADRLQSLVGDLLFIAQIDAGRLTLERGTVDLATVATESVEAARPHAAHKRIELELAAHPALTVEGDCGRLGQVLDNLVSNAIKFTPDGGRVTVCLFEAADRAVLEITDTGIGIPQDEQARLFERFFRSTTATAQAIQGTGLGLSIVEAIVDAHGGTIGLWSEPGSGTTFRVELPLGEPVTLELAA